ncbi:MAG: FMN-binding protein [Clostridia bacterium]|nr:FMN-binding protein [Clostridia bacterium]
MRDSIKPILIAALTLAVITAVVVAALGLTDLLTRDTIAAQSEKATNEACQAFFENATFGEAALPASGAWPEGVVAVYEAKRDGAVVGYVVKTSTTGKASGLEVMTGIGIDGAVVGVSVVNDGETAGYVKSVTEGGLLDRLKGVKGDASAVEGVSQATKTSNGIKEGVSLALAVYEEVKA